MPTLQCMPLRKAHTIPLAVFQTSFQSRPIDGLRMDTGHSENPQTTELSAGKISPGPESDCEHANLEKVDGDHKLYIIAKYWYLSLMTIAHIFNFLLELIGMNMYK